MANQVCASCEYIETKTVERGCVRDFIVTCKKEHAPIFLFSGGDCEDYQKWRARNEKSNEIYLRFLQ